MEWEKEVVIRRVTTDSLDKRVTELETAVEQLTDIARLLSAKVFGEE